MYVATPMNNTTGRITRAISVKASPNPDAPPTSPKATIAPDNVVRNIPARLNASFHAGDGDASRLQCSVERIWSRIAGEPSRAEPTCVGGPGSAPKPPTVARSKDI